MRYKFLLFFIFVVVWNILFSSSFSIILTPDGLRISTFSPLLFSFSGDSIKLGYGWEREYDVFKETMLKLGPFKKKVKVKLSNSISNGLTNLIFMGKFSMKIMSAKLASSHELLDYIHQHRKIPKIMLKRSSLDYWL